MPKASSAATQPALRWPLAKARATISSAISVFDRYRRLSAGTPAAVHRP